MSEQRGKSGDGQNNSHSIRHTRSPIDSASVPVPASRIRRIEFANPDIASSYYQVVGQEDAYEGSKEDGVAAEESEE